MNSSLPTATGEPRHHDMFATHPDELDWASARAHLKTLYDFYSHHILFCMTQLTVSILPLMRKLNQGTRTRKLHNEIMALTPTLSDQVDRQHENGRPS